MSYWRFHDSIVDGASVEERMKDKKTNYEIYRVSYIRLKTEPLNDHSRVCLHVCPSISHPIFSESTGQKYLNKTGNELGNLITNV